MNDLDRRDFCKLSTLAISSLCYPNALMAKRANDRLIRKTIPTSKHIIPAIGMGTWITFNVGQNKLLRDERSKVLKAFFDAGGSLIDSSPMYGSAQEVLGYGLKKLNHPVPLFAADKIWTSSTEEGPRQFKEMQELWGIKNFGLIQIHNLVNWRAHLTLLNKLKSEGKATHIGITSSHGRYHQEPESIMKKEQIDFVQLR